MGRRLLRKLGMAEYGGDELCIAFVAFSSSAYMLFQYVHPLVALLPVLPMGIVLWFFRDPERQIVAKVGEMLSPADGTVSDICEKEEPLFPSGKALRIGIFLSPFNVHVNRVPCDCKVLSVDFKRGEFLPAYNPEAPTRNESCRMDLMTASGLQIAVKQITGILARRIICESQTGDTLACGTRYGMIKFGSRTELYIPVESLDVVLIKIGDKVVGGQTPLCRVKAVLNPQPVTAQSEYAKEA